LKKFLNNFRIASFKQVFKKFLVAFCGEILRKYLRVKQVGWILFMHQSQDVLQDSTHLPIFLWYCVVQDKASWTWPCPKSFSFNFWMTENSFKMKNLGNKAMSYEVKWKLSAPLVEVYTQTLTQIFTQYKASSDECMKVKDERQALINTIGEKTPCDWE
jgi:hypothetical protein